MNIAKLYIVSRKRRKDGMSVTYTGSYGRYRVVLFTLTGCMATWWSFPPL